MSQYIYAITKLNGKIFSFLLQNQKAVEIHCDALEDQSILNNIYIGKIKNIAKNIGAAFVEIAPGSTCYLALDDVKNPVYTKKGASKFPQAGDELLVQVSREGIKTKFPSVTTNITLYGKYALLTTGKRQVSVSSKLSKEEKERLLNVMKRVETANTGTSSAVNESANTGTSADNESASTDTSADNESANTGTSSADNESASTDTSAAVNESANTGTSAAVNESGNAGTSATAAASAVSGESIINPKNRSYGWLLRTNAGTATEDLLIKDIERLRRQYITLMQQAQYRTCFSCLLKTPSAYLSRLSNLYDEANAQIMTDDEELYQEIREYLTIYQPEDLGRLSFYDDKLLPMHKLFSLEHQLQQALSERVWMNSGGYLVIQPTEALTVVDVNTGKFEGGKKKEAAFLKINLEAAVEIARQIRLRNISGIIIVDFINMESAESRKELLVRLDMELKKDPVKTVLVDMTKLSLVEITRMKKERPLAESARM